MAQVFNEIKTPYKYGVVFKHPDANKLMDSPTIFKKNGVWYMTYIVFDGKGMKPGSPRAKIYWIGNHWVKFFLFQKIPGTLTKRQDICHW